MAQKEHQQLVFKFGEVEYEPDDIENKEEWGLMDMAQNELPQLLLPLLPC